MANPAQLLLTQLSAWRAPSSTAEAHRSPVSDEWLSHRLAVRHIDAIDQLLGEMAAAGRNVGVYRRYLPQWTSMVFSFPRGWQAARSGDLDRGQLEHLENLADALRDFVPTLEEGGLDRIRDYADEVSATLIADNSLPQELRLHSLEVVEHLKWCANQYDVVGDFDLQEALERLAATVVRVAANSDEENRNKVWGPVMSNWVWPFVTNMVAAIPSQALTMLALGPGA